MTDWGKYTTPTKFLEQSDIERAASEMSELADQQGVAAVLIGGAALRYFGSPRLTTDIDFAATGPLEGSKETGKLTFGGEKLSAPSGVPVDWVQRDDDYAELYSEAIEHPMPERDSPSPVPIARPEYLLAMKMAAGRRKDLDDVEWMIANSVVDLPLARRIVRKHLGTYAARELDSIVSEVEWKKSRGEL